MKPRRSRRLAGPVFARLALVSLLVFCAAPAAARPGGGHGFSGGGYRGGGGGGFRSSGGYRGGAYGVGRSPGYATGGGNLGFALAILIVVTAVVLANGLRNTSPPSWDSQPAPPRRRSSGPGLEAIRRLDPDFSSVLFEDFAYALYARAHQARASRRELDALAPYLSAGVRSALAARQPAAPVTAVVVGALRVLRVSLPAPDAALQQVRVGLEFEANLTVGEPGAEQTRYVVEHWDLTRAAGVRTKPPEAVRSFHCPSCGAPFASSGNDRCEYCGEVVSGGRFDWTATAVRVLSDEARPPGLTGTVEEQGTELPTVFQPGVMERFAALLRDDPAVTEEALVERLELIYHQLNLAWTNRDLTPARPYVTDSLYDYLQYWVEAYRRQGLRNVLQEMRITGVDLAKVVRDRWYDAVTFRVGATGRDSTVRVADGTLVGGNPRRDREYTEYWTLIRGAGVRGAPHTDKSCPNCGASLSVSQAGQCDHCGALITRGDFDWVLSRIEQDDSYSG